MSSAARRRRHGSRFAEASREAPGWAPATPLIECASRGARIGCSKCSAHAPGALRASVPINIAATDRAYSFVISGNAGEPANGGGDGASAGGVVSSGRSVASMGSSWRARHAMYSLALKWAGTQLSNRTAWSPAEERSASEVRWPPKLSSRLGTPPGRSTQRDRSELHEVRNHDGASGRRSSETSASRRARGGSSTSSSSRRCAHQADSSLQASSDDGPCSSSSNAASSTGRCRATSSGLSVSPRCHTEQSILRPFTSRARVADPVAESDAATPSCATP